MADKNQKLARWYFGGLGSAGAACCTHPLDLLKVQLQTQQEGRVSVVGLTVRIVKSEGALALYNGLSASLCRQLSYSTVRFGIYEVGKQSMSSPGENIPFYKRVILASVAGAAGGFVGTPADMVNVRMQNDMKLSADKRRNYKHAIDGLFRVWKEEGFVRLFSGATTATSRAVFMTIGQLSFYDQVKQLLLGSGIFQDNLATHFISSLTAGAVATTLTQPLDVLKTRAMNAKPGEFAGMWDLISYTAKMGPLGFFKVTVRIRPLHPEEDGRSVFVLDDKTIILEEEDNPNDVLRQGRSTEKHYVFDFVIGENVSQKTVYELTTKNLVKGIVSGYNGTVFAYGATGSGKTYTMIGNNANDHPGIMVQALNDLFTIINGDTRQYTVILSYLEVYNENIRDLLNPHSGFLELREDPNQEYPNVHVAGLTEITATSTEQVLELLEKGNQERTIESTAANICSSRSHAMLSITVKKTSQIQGRGGMKTRIKQGRLFMVDLAGSERASHTKNRGKRLQEGAHINRSLLALGNCINALSNGANPRYINYRDSKLTRLLREPLSGNCRTVMIAHINPACIYREETRNTLVYASRASVIINKVEANVIDVSFHAARYKTLISDLRNEISRLKSKVEEKQITSSRHKNDDHIRNETKKIREKIVNVFREQMKLRRRLMDIDGHLLSLGVEAERQHQIISQWESRNNKLYYGSHFLSRRRSKSESSTYSRIESGGREKDTCDEHQYFSMNQAWAELNYIEREQERYISLRSKTINELDNLRQKAVTIENDLPSQLNSETEKELLSLLCRVHELEADKIALQGERLLESHELRRRGDLLTRFHRQQNISDTIITRQRQIMEDKKIALPNDLQELYKSYQQEIHATTYNSPDVETNKLSDNRQFANHFAVTNDEKHEYPQNKSSGYSSSTIEISNNSTPSDETRIGLPIVQLLPTDNKRTLQPSPIPATILFPPIHS